MLSYGTLTAQFDGEEQGRFIPKFQQSKNAWAAVNRRAAIYFHTETMQHVTVGAQGAWAVVSWH